MTSSSCKMGITKFVCIKFYYYRLRHCRCFHGDVRLQEDAGASVEGAVGGRGQVRLRLLAVAIPAAVAIVVTVALAVTVRLLGNRAKG